ncbi:tetratricopeptide repeat protein [Granulicella cerasi]|uniref:Tetratricopeptide repeat protein n=1 Tax=Granulicella cerasi TaxID=741063 RepID=A0ABW1Z4P6_9BACT|nr:hypothetical protein [Granulicella cerasi]
MGVCGQFRRLLLLAVAATSISSVASAQMAVPPHTAPLNVDPQVRQAFDHFYSLDFNDALHGWQIVAQQHPNDPMAYNYLLLGTLFRELYIQDLLDTTYYAHDSFLLNKRQVNVSPAVRQQIEDLSNRVIDMCDSALKKDPNDKNALFARSYAKGMHASFLILVDHSWSAAAKQGLSARNDSEAALKIDPQYADANMAVGIQQYAVASLPRVIRILVGFFGVGGNKQRGLEMLRISAAHGPVTSVESRTALSLFLRHDGRYSEALQVERSLAQQYPRDFLFRLEVANLLKDDGQGVQAIAEYKKVLEDAGKPGYFTEPRLQLAYFGLGETQRGYNDIQGAADSFLKAAQQPNCSDWLRKRAQLNAGNMYDLLHDRTQAVRLYNMAAAPGGDQSQADAARKYLKQPYTR